MITPGNTNKHHAKHQKWVGGFISKSESESESKDSDSIQSIYTKWSKPKVFVFGQYLVWVRSAQLNNRSKIGKKMVIGGT